MASNRLTDRKVSTAAPDAAEYLLADGDGLYLRVRPTGKDWLFKYSLGGKRPKMGLGPYPDVSLERARKKAQEARSIVAEGHDPMVAREAKAIEERAQAAALANRHTVRTLFTLWLDMELGKSRKDAGAEIKRAFEKDVLPTFGDMYVEEMRRRHVMQVLDKVKERGVTRYANQLLQYLRQMFQFAGVREIVAADPTFGIKRRDVGGAELERTRTLSEDEILDLVAKLPDSGLLPSTQAALWAILATCCRVGEITRARWEDIDFKASTWTIRAENAKNGRAHLVHLSNFAREQFQKLEDMSVDKTWLFPGISGDCHMDTKALQKQFKDRQRTTKLKGRSKDTGTLVLTGGPWTAHDLRRTGATMMGELGIRPDVIDRCLNHIGGDKLRKTYQRQEMLMERQAAFAVLGDRLSLLARGRLETVVLGQFPRAA